MASRTHIQTALQKPYDRVLFGKEVLNPVFGSCLILSNSPVPPNSQPNKSESPVIQSVSIYGKINLEDNTEITLYEIVLQSTVRIEQSKVAIQRYVRKLLTAGQIALVNFISPQNKKVWRLTLVAKDSEVTEDGIKEKTTHSKRFTYLLGPSEACKTAAERFETLSTERIISFQALVNAFSVEKLSEAFFDEYTLHYRNFCNYLQDSNFRKSVFNISIPTNATQQQKDQACKPIRDFVKKLLGRIVFLYFVQKKGWLGASDIEYRDGLNDFIKQLFIQSGGNDAFYNVWLTVLFFETLNKERPNNDFIMPDGKKVKVPFLNGGLFDKEEHDEHVLTFKAKLFHNPDFEDIVLTAKNHGTSRGFLDFLNAFNFTVHEDSPDDHTIAVDPEMLGRIFENLLEDNKDKGAFYTPKGIVHFMCQETLLEYLVTQLKIQNENLKEGLSQLIKSKEINDQIKGKLPEIDKLLENVKVCDPAIGSGAFPMGLLLEIHSIKEVIAFELGRSWKPAEVKENIIQNSIYGVDIEKGAVDIARLRFWLSLVVDEEKPRALPNLDYKIVVGNTLVSKFEGEIIEIDWDQKRHTNTSKTFIENIQALLKQIANSQRIFFKPETRDKRKLQAEIRTLKLELLINQLSFNKEKFLASNVEKGGFAPTASDLQFNQELKAKRNFFDKNTAKLQHLKKNKEEPFEHFDWKLDFPEVLNPYLVNSNGGFDIVIGNPPYLRVQGIREKYPSDVEYYLKKYKSATGRFDLYVLFTECCYGLLSETGILNFIQPDKWVNADFGRGLRRILSKNVVRLISFGQSQVFNVSTYSSLVWITFMKTGHMKYHKIDVELKQESEIQNYLASLDKSQYSELDNDHFSDQPWVLTSNESAGLMAQLISLKSTVSDYFSSVSQGIVSVGDDIFILEGEINGQLFRGYSHKIKDQITIESEIMKPLLKGDDVTRYASLQNEAYVIYPHYEMNGKTIPYEENDLKDKFPKAYNYFLPFKDELIKKKIKYKTNPKHWYSLHRSREISLFKSEKLVTPEISLGSNFALDTSGFFHNTQVYSLVKKRIINTDIKVFLAILNSNVAWYYLKSTGAVLRGGYFRFKTNYLEPYPIPNITGESIQPLIRLVEYLLFLNSEKLEDINDKLVSVFFDQILNGIVYNLYFPELLKRYDREIIKHLGELPQFNSKMSDSEKLKICRVVFTRLDHKEHPIRTNIFYMSSIPEIKIIEGKHENN